MKYLHKYATASITVSLPSRERGLKFYCAIALWVDIQSLPSRERGLKFAISFSDIDAQLVAPFAGAWIEILNMIDEY